MCPPRPSPLQNRVLPTGEIVADPARGMFTGNRGILPFTEGRLGTSRWKHQHWIICDLKHPKGRYHGPMPARAWTPLFFLDEAVGLPAGHRPCAYCRPNAYRAFKLAWAEAHGPAGHLQMDRQLHKARVTRSRQQVRYMANCTDLPDGTFVILDGQPHLLREDSAYLFTMHGYSSSAARPNLPVEVLTPAATVETMRAGFQPKLFPNA